MKDIPALLEKNLQLLQKSQPKLTARLRARLEEHSGLQEPFFRETPAGRWIEGLTEKPFFEKKASLEKRPTAAPSPVYFVYGVGCAPYLFHVLRSLPREALSVVVVEPSLDLVLLTLSQTSVFQALPAGCNLSFIVDKDRTLIDEAFAWNVVPIGIFPVSKGQAVIHEGEEAFVAMTDLNQTLRKEIIYRLTMLGNSPEDTLLGFRHAVLNTLRTIQSPPIAALKENYGGKPFVCVASGPSLEKNVHMLKDIQDKCVIVACDTVLFHLLEKGILPHIVTTIERPYVTYRAWVPKVLDKYNEECKSILLLSQSVSYPATAGRWPGPNIVVGKMDVPVDSWFTGAVLGEQVLYSGLSVSHMAYSTAIACNASAAALIGQDLAYSPEGASHASDTVSDSALKVEQSRRKGITVPAALGGVVETSAIWLTFTQIFERMISGFSEPSLYDCTEGGALIEGTTIAPLDEFIRERVLVDGNAVTRWVAHGHTKKLKEDLPARFKVAFSQLDMVEQGLKEMSSEIKKTTAPALLPEIRQGHAFKTAGILDKIHAINPVISFIGQSYTHLSGSVLAENRFLETVDQVEKWKALHEEIVQGHTFAVEFLRQWLSFAQDLIKFADEIPAHRDSLGEEAFARLYAQMPPGQAAVPPELTEILSRNDPVTENWSPDNLWKSALILFAQGRAYEARVFMNKVYKDLEGKNLPVQTMGAFFKDWSKIVAADDLTAQPDLNKAVVLLSNAREHLPDDPEIVTLQQEIAQQGRRGARDLRILLAKDDEQNALLILKKEAEASLLAGDLINALSQVNNLVWQSLENFPGTAIPHLEWLMKTTADCTEAADAALARLAANIAEGIIEKLPTLAGRQINFPGEFLALMEEKGLKFSLEPSDNH